MTDTEETVVFAGYLAELIRLQAERAGMDAETYVVSLVAKRCNAPTSKGDQTWAWTTRQR